MDKAERNKRWASGAEYNQYISEELNSFRKDAWKQQISKHFNGLKGLEILDVGTGPGFFSIILSELGHTVTGIDSSEGMLAYARENASRMGVHPVFCSMDINAMTFADETFDVVLSRNVTWTLENPELVYAEFKRILKPGGILLIYDANWQMHFFDEELYSRVKARENSHLEKYGSAKIVSVGDLEYYKTAPLTRMQRPKWDEKVLKDHLGMNVSIQQNIGEFVYEEWERELYGESPLFEICAVKISEPAAQQNMKKYWQKRSETFGFPDDSQVQEFREVIKKYIPEAPQKVLDIGTGTGIMAAAAAGLGHNVTAVDLCSNMLEEASANLAAYGLSAAFVCSPADELPFADETFDVIISRNLLWALPDPDAALSSWGRVLKKNGILLYWDGNHYRYLTDPVEQHYRRQLASLWNGSPHWERSKGREVDYSLCDDTAKDLPLSSLNRPSEWDEKALPKHGFRIFAEEIQRPQELLSLGIGKGFYTTFTIAAVNKKA